MPARGFFICGTDTGVGKTYSAAILVRTLAHAGWRVAVMKPVAAGASTTAEGLRNDDALALAAAANVAADYHTVNPCCLAAPVSPHLAALEAGVRIEIEPILRSFRAQAARADCVIVEGAGGWLAPIDPDRTMADIACALGLPVILVVGLRLGCLNHAQLSMRAIRASGLPLAGWIANHIDPALERASENVATLTHLLGAEPLLQLPWAAQAAGSAPGIAAPSAGAALVQRLSRYPPVHPVG